MAHEPVPEPLEMIAKELLIPLHGLFHQLVQQVLPSKLGLCSSLGCHELVPHGFDAHS